MIHVGSPAFEAGEEMAQRAQEILRRAREREHERWPAAFHYYSDYQLEMAAENTAMHLEFITAAVWAGEQILFDDYLKWCKVRFRGLGMSFDMLTGSQEEIRDAIVDTVQPATARLASNTVNEALAKFPSFTDVVETSIDPGGTLAGPALAYSKAVLAGNRPTASKIVVDALESGVPVGDIYCYFFERTQNELGRMWQSNVITVAQEHIATEITRAVMAQIYPYISTAEKGSRTVVVAAVGRENHGIAARIVADAFEMARWQTINVGANTPVGTLIETVLQADATVLALSAAMANHVPDVGEAIRLLRDDPRTAHVCVLVGGYPFNLAPELWRTVGADGTAATAREGVAVAAQLCA